MRAAPTLLAILLVACGCDGERSELRVPTDDGFLVIGFGYELDPPYEFTGVESDTLFLNGLQYWPPAARPRQPIEIPADKMALYTLRGELIERELAASAAIADSVQRLCAFADALGASPLVRSVTTHEEGLAVLLQWEDDGLEHYIDLRPIGIPFPPEEPGDRTQHHMNIVARFWKVAERGGVVVFGTSTFQLGGSRRHAERARAVLRRLDHGEEPTDADLESEALRGRILEEVLWDRENGSAR